MILQSTSSCLCCFEEAPKIASGSTYTPSSKVYMLVKGLVSFCEARMVNRLKNSLKGQLLFQLKNYFVPYPKFILELYKRVACLHPVDSERLKWREWRLVTYKLT